MKKFAQASVELCVVFVCLNHIINLVESHGRMLKPPGRSSLWRFAEFQSADVPVNYDDNQLYCGGVHQKDNPGSNCGVCGDPYSASLPRPNEIGGKFYSEIITAQYFSGDLIMVQSQITAAHAGFMEWRLCSEPERESQACFNQNVLQVGDGSGSRIDVGFETGIYWAKLRLPKNVTCDHCVIQWNYRAGNNWGFCADGEGRLGCGAQETFRGCSDVRIVPRPKRRESEGRANDEEGIQETRIN